MVTPLETEQYTEGAHGAGKEVEQAKNRVVTECGSEWDPMNGGFTQESDAEFFAPGVEYSIVVEYLSFRKELAGATRKKLKITEKEDALLRYPRNSKPSTRLRLHQHPLAARSFVMFPGYSEIETPYGRINTHPRAATIWDFQHFLRTEQYVLFSSERSSSLELKKNVRLDKEFTHDDGEQVFISNGPPRGFGTCKTWRAIFSKW